MAKPGQPSCGAAGCLVIIAFAGLATVISWFSPKPRNVAPSVVPQPTADVAPIGEAAPTAIVAPLRKSLNVGDTGKLMLQGGSGVWLCLDEASWDAMLDAQNAGARGGPGSLALIYRLAKADKVKFYPNGTRVLVIKNGMVSKQVEVIEGDDRGDQGWVQFELVAPEK